ncbi:MAG: hypothetical protein IJX91_02590 [Clostridia bacterium]|nr:hypothetical protein [Clostridia bacterium]
MITQQIKKYDTPSINIVSFEPIDVLTGSVGFQYPFTSEGDLGWGD